MLGDTGLLLPSVIKTLAFSYPIELVIFFLFYLVKDRWLQAGGIKDSDRAAIFSNREEGFDLKALLSQYGDRQLLIIDGICRKSAHVTGAIFFSIMTTLVVKRTEFTIITSLLWMIIRCVTLVAFLRNNGFLGRVLFGAWARIRDGKRGRQNILVANLLIVLTVCLLGGMSQILLHFAVPELHVLHLIRISLIPFIFGDAAAEIIGSTFGRQTIKVWGIGEINRKSWAGTSAMFFATLVAMTAYIAVSGLSPWWYPISIFLAAISTVVELFAPRSTDNMFLMVINFLLVGAMAVIFQI